MSVGSWTWLIARCWWPSWIQRAPQLVQVAVGYRPKPMVTRADRHSGQRGIRAPLSFFLAVVATYGRGRRVEPGAEPAHSGSGPGSTYLGVASWLLAPSLLAAGTSMRPGRTWMRLGLASSALGTRIWSTPSSNEAWIPSAIAWAGRVIDRRKAP